MGKKLNQNKRREDGEMSTKNKVISMIILIIMVMSVAGYALISGGDTGGNDSANQEVPLQQVEYQGQVLWVAVKNSQQFVFFNIDRYVGDSEMEALANKIKANKAISLYVDSSFNSGDSLYLIEKALKGLKIKFTRSYDSSCSTPTLVLTINETAVYNENCYVLLADSISSYNSSENLVYQLVK